MTNLEALKETCRNEKRVAVRKRSLQLIEFFEPLLKDEFDKKELEKIVHQFIKDCEWKTPNQIRNLYNSLTTRDRTEKYKELKFVNSNEKYRDCWGRTRLYCNWWTHDKVVAKERAIKREAKKLKEAQKPIQEVVTKEKAMKKEPKKAKGAKKGKKT